MSEADLNIQAISIALATYNGAKYLQEQLDSFTRQTRLPDEVVISDDGSTDETMAILDNIAQTPPAEFGLASAKMAAGLPPLGPVTGPARGPRLSVRLRAKLADDRSECVTLTCRRPQ